MSRNEREKKRAYNHRILEVEKGSFTTLVLSTTGGMSPECTRFFKRVAELISVKRGEVYSDVMNYIRNVNSYVLIEINTDCGNNIPVSVISLNLIPSQQTYEA